MLIYAIGIDPNFMPSQTPTPQDLVEFTLILYQKEESLRYGKKLKNIITYSQQSKKQNYKWAKNSSVIDTSAHFFGQHNQMIKCNLLS